MGEKHASVRILFLTTGKGHGGPTSFLYYLLTYLDSGRFIPTVAFYFPDAGPDIQKIEALGVPVFFLSRKEDSDNNGSVQPLFGRFLPRIVRKAIVLLKLLLRIATTDIPATLRLCQLIRREKIDVVVLNNDVHYHLAGVLGTKLAGIPCICRKAGGIGEGRIYKKFLTPLVSLFIAVSKATEDDQRINNPGTRRLVTVHEGINLELFDTRAPNSGIREEFGIPPSRKVVVSVSRLDWGKGHRELLNAVALIAGAERDVVFLIVGDGVTRDELTAQARSLNLGDRVIFTGWRNDISAVLSMADIFIHCPTTSLEGLGIANLEAMAMGKPTIVSENGGLTDAVVDGVTGYVVSPGDERRMAEAIMKLLDDEQLARRLGKNARKRVDRYFNIKKNVRMLEMLMAEVAGFQPHVNREVQWVPVQRSMSLSSDSTGATSAEMDGTLKQAVFVRQRREHIKIHARGRESRTADRRSPGSRTHI